MLYHDVLAFIKNYLIELKANNHNDVHIFNFMKVMITHFSMVNFFWKIPHEKVCTPPLKIVTHHLHLPAVNNY